MRSRVFVLFWGSTASAVLFLGASWTLMGRIRSPEGALHDGVFLTAAIVGLLVTGAASARIAFVIGRSLRPVRRQDHSGPSGRSRGRGSTTPTPTSP